MTTEISVHLLIKGKFRGTILSGVMTGIRVGTMLLCQEMMITITMWTIVDIKIKTSSLWVNMIKGKETEMMTSEIL